MVSKTGKQVTFNQLVESLKGKKQFIKKNFENALLNTLSIFGLLKDWKKKQIQ